MANAQELTTVKFGQVGSLTAAETTLLNLFTQPGLLRNDGDMVYVVAIAVSAANANNKTVRVHFGPTNVCGRGPAADNASVYVCQAWITRKSPIVAQGTGIVTNLTTATTVVLNRDSIAFDANAPVEIKLTGEASTANNDVVSRLLKYEYFPANSNFNF